MNYDRQIAAEFLRNIHFLPHFKSKTTGPIFTKFLYDVEALAALLMRAYTRRRCIPFRAMATIKAVNFDACEMPPKLIGYHNNVPWATAKIMST